MDRLTLWEDGDGKTIGEINHKCDWREGYYGWECECGNFIPYGCEPWTPTEDELHDMILRAKPPEV